MHVCPTHLSAIKLIVATVKSDTIDYVHVVSNIYVVTNGGIYALTYFLLVANPPPYSSGGGAYPPPQSGYPPPQSGYPPPQQGFAARPGEYQPYQAGTNTTTVTAVVAQPAVIHQVTQSL